MDKVRYMISDAADMVHVETHVLRYWEEELELAIPRNEMGHRYYTRDNIKEFQKIKDLKDQGYQLKAIRMILHSDDLLQEKSAVENRESVEARMLPQPSVRETGVTAELSAEERMCQFRELMSDIVGKAIAQNNEELSQSIGRDVQEMVIKEMNYLMREQDAAQEERYRKLDAAIRGGLKKSSLFVHNKKRPAN